MFYFNLDNAHVYRDCVAVGNTGRYVVIDSRETFDAGYETMVFESSGDGDVLDWGELDVERYDNWEEMKKGHETICEKWKEKEDMKGIWDD